MQSQVARLCRVLGCLTVYQNSRFFISRKGTSAAGVNEVKEGPDYSITGIMGTRVRTTQLWAWNRREGSPEMGWAVRGEGCIPSGSVLQDWVCRDKPQCWEREAGLELAGLPLPAGGEAGWQCQEGVVGRQGLRWSCCH